MSECQQLLNSPVFNEVASEFHALEQKETQCVNIVLSAPVMELEHDSDIQWTSGVEARAGTKNPPGADLPASLQDERLKGKQHPRPHTSVHLHSH